MESSNLDSHLLDPPEPVVFRHGLGNTIEMLRAALRYVGIKADPNRLAGSSGIAFRVHWPVRPSANRTERPCWDAVVAAVCPFDPTTNACESYGWRVLSYRNIEASVAWQFAIQSLSHRRPALSYGFLGEPEDVLLTGFGMSAQERTLHVLTRHARSPIRSVLADRSWPGVDDRGHCIGILDSVRPDRRLAPLDAIHRALRRAVWISQSDVVRGGTRYLSGVQAYEAWIERLLTPQVGPTALEAAERVAASYGCEIPNDKEQAGEIGLRHVLHRALTALCDARGWAIRFLEGPGQSFDVAGAAASFAEEERSLREAAGFWPPVVEGDATRFALAPAPEGYQQELRLEETARCLRVAADAYRMAINEIEERVVPVEQELHDPDTGTETR